MDDDAFADDALLGVVPSLLVGLRVGGAEDEQIESLLTLAQIVDSTFGERAVQLCSLIADHGGVELLGALVASPRAWLHQTAMLVLGNLASDSSTIEAAFKEAGCFEKLLPHLHSDDAGTVKFALGAIRNVCGDPDYVSLMQKHGAMRRLQVQLSTAQSPFRLHAPLRTCHAPRERPPPQSAPSDLHRPSRPHPTAVPRTRRSCPTRSTMRIRARARARPAPMPFPPSTWSLPSPSPHPAPSPSPVPQARYWLHFVHGG